MKNDFGYTTFWIVVGFMLGLAFGRHTGFNKGWAEGCADQKASAVHAGHAHYVITDPKTGATAFQWREEK